MSEYKNSIKTAAYQVSKDMKAQERRYKEAQKLAKKRKDRIIAEALYYEEKPKRSN